MFIVLEKERSYVPCVSLVFTLCKKISREMFTKCSEQCSLLRAMTIFTLTCIKCCTKKSSKCSDVQNSGCVFAWNVHRVTHCVRGSPLRYDSHEANMIFVFVNLFYLYILTFSYFHISPNSAIIWNISKQKNIKEKQNFVHSSPQDWGRNRFCINVIWPHFPPCILYISNFIFLWKSSSISMKKQ